MIILDSLSLIVGLERGAERAENWMERSGVASGRCRQNWAKTHEDILTTHHTPLTHHGMRHQANCRRRSTNAAVWLLLLL